MATMTLSYLGCIVVMYASFTQALCPPGFQVFEYTHTGCKPDKLDCSDTADGKDKLEATLLKQSEVKTCVQGHSITDLDVDSNDPECPLVPGYQSGVTYVKVPAVNPSCTFCFKLNIVRFNLYDIYPDNSECPQNNLTPRSTLKSVKYVKWGEGVSISIEKIGPDKVTVDFIQTDDLTLKAVRKETLTFFNTEDDRKRLMHLKIGPVYANYTLRLTNPSTGIVGEPKAVYIRIDRPMFPY